MNRKYETYNLQNCFRTRKNITHDIQNPPAKRARRTHPRPPASYWCYGTDATPIFRILLGPLTRVALVITQYWT